MVRKKQKKNKTLSEFFILPCWTGCYVDPGCQTQFHRGDDDDVSDDGDDGDEVIV